ncbi:MULTISPECIES: mechanosensitive ion channel family protein [Thalassospira]|uniref:Mechanosensitive ion channel protein MscS n=1 Tax=Thalassospira profundimaris TaxID=502049 RepID=A0A367V664_9PROT|nr:MULTISPECIES: mechanosensitive ion channel family protein [Thalassospira]KZB72948.1 mechanosensitive ion channel protein MscS [Thalassospira sp. MCCC 1A01148]MBR9900170.1 mechanosensitive ion channel family protein [Rhodospirillales bacterium]RCK20643.1 mechanosensitive ion channel protein MscS [Thalassospira profundimaris]
MDEITTELDNLNEEVIGQMNSWVDMLGGGEVGRLIGALLVLVVFFIFKRVLVRGALGILRRIAQQRSESMMANVLDAFALPLQALFMLLGVYFATEVLTLPDEIDAFAVEAISIAAGFCVFWALFRAVEPLGVSLNRLVGRFGAGLGDDLRQFFIRGVKTLIVVIGGVIILENWGIDVSAFLGGLGLAGMAVALAAKDSVANIFGGLTIFADNLYKRGDWIETPHFEGTVEVVGLRATKVRTFAKALVTMPNAQIVDSPVINWSRMTHRRIKMVIGLEYRTTAKQMEAIVDKLRDFLKNDEDVAQTDVAQMVHFSDFGASSINIDLYYFTKTTDWVTWRDIRNRHIIAFKRIVEEEGAAFAFPSQSLYVESMPEFSNSPNDDQRAERKIG